MKPILFNTGMVRAILDDRKTVTRQIIKPQPLNKPMVFHDEEEGLNICCHVDTRNTLYNFFPPYEVGDILYVRETWSPVYVMPKRYIYKADADYGIGEGAKLPIKWHPSIHMPKEAARIFLRVKSVRVERLQDDKV